MGRRGGGGSFGSRRSSSSSSSSSSSRTTTATRPASTSSNSPATTSKAGSPANAQTQSHAPAPAGGYGGGGGQSFLGGVAQLGAGIAVGHVAGRALENMFFGGHGNASPEEIKEVEKKVKTGPCSFQYESFNKCLEHNENDVAQCDWAFDMFKTCQMNNKEQTLNQ